MARLKVALAPVLIGAVVLGALALAIFAILHMDPHARRGPRTGRRYIEQAAGAPIDPDLLRWRELLPPIALELRSPRAIALDSADRIYVAGERLVVLEPEGAPRLRSAELAGRVLAVAVGSAGRVHLATARKVRSFAIAGERLELLSEVNIAEPGTALAALAVGAHGLFAADAGRCRVLRITPGEGRGYEVFAAGFVVPSVMDLCAGADGELITVDPGRHRVQLRDAYGDVVRAFGAEGATIRDFHGCCNPAAVALLPGGRIATAEKGLVALRVKVYSGAGELESVVATPRDFDRRPDGPPIHLDLAADSRGRILVLDPSRRQVRIFKPKDDPEGSR